MNIEFLGFCDIFTAVYEVEGSNITIPLSLSVSPHYAENSSLMYHLDSDLAKIVGREFLAQPKYALTCVHSYARRNNLYAGRSLMCDETLQKIFGKVGVKLDTVWPILSQKMRRRDVETVQFSFLLTDFDKSYSQSILIKSNERGTIFPSFYQGNKKMPMLKKVNSLNLSPKKKMQRSFRRNRSIEL